MAALFLAAAAPRVAYACALVNVFMLMSLAPLKNRGGDERMIDGN